MDFNIRFDVEQDIFLKKWSQCKENAKHVYELYGNTVGLATGFDGEVENFLLLLKVLPERQRGRKTTTKRLNFIDSIEKLVVFCKVIHFHLLFSTH